MVFSYFYLYRHFATLEERSIFLISNAKETEQLVESLRTTYEENKKRLGDQYEAKLKMKQDLQRNVEVKIYKFFIIHFYFSKLVERDIQNLKITKNDCKLNFIFFFDFTFNFGKMMFQKSSKTLQLQYNHKFN